MLVSLSHTFIAIKMTERIISLSRVKPIVSEVDTVNYAKANNSRRAFDVLQEAHTYWFAMSRFRRERERNKRYNYGDQWKDMVKVEDKMMSEEEYITSQGNIPLKNNLIRRLVNTVLGVYRQQSKEPVCTARDREEQQVGETMSTILQCNMQLNRMSEIYPRSMEEFLISGMIVHKKWYGWRSENNKLDCWTDVVNLNNFFIDNNMRDFRGWDVSCLGELHDISFGKLCERFAHSDADVQRLKELYHWTHDKKSYNIYMAQFGYALDKNYDFFCNNDGSTCRVIEVWRKETKPRYRCHDYNNGDVYKIETEDYEQMVEAVNADRIARGLAQGMQQEDIPLVKATWFVDEYWYYYFLTPFGDILAEGETPYGHKSHPYTFKCYPYIDGEIHAFVNDVIDQQRYTNRLITLYDWIMRASAKGVLIFPEDCLPEGMDINDISDEWARFNGVIAIKKNSTQLPQQIANNSTNIGITELLNLQLKFFEEVTGVQGALQGKAGMSGMSASLYAQQTQNATTSLLDLLESFGQFVIDSAYKDVKNIQQFYDDKRVFNIAGKSGKMIVYDPKVLRDIEFDLSIVESTATPAYRMMQNDFLMEIWRSQQISLQQLLENGDFPFADQLLQSIKTQQEQLQNGQVPEGVSPDMMAQAQQGADMNAVNQAYNMLRQ